MSDIQQTVRIENSDIESGFVIINKSDFDASIHSIFVEKSAEPVAPIVPPAENNHDKNKPSK